MNLINCFNIYSLRNYQLICWSAATNLINMSMVQILSLFCCPFLSLLLSILQSICWHRILVFFLLSSSYKLVSRAKSLNWSVEWGLDEDSNLLKGIYEYGVGNWEALKMDPELNLHEKVKTRTKKKSALIITTFKSLTSNKCGIIGKKNFFKVFIY